MSSCRAASAVWPSRVCAVARAYHVPSGDRPRERGPLFTPRGFFFFGGVVSRRLAWPSERRHGVVVLVRGEQRETGGDRAAGDGRRAQQAVRDRVERGKRRGPGSR